MRELHDRYFRQAKREGRLARSFYKLEEIDRRARLFRRGQRVLDLGASPGSWLEYALERIQPGGVACAVDLKPIHKKFKGKAHFLKADIRELAADAFADVARQFDVIVSDMAPNTSGIRVVDQARSLELCETAWKLAAIRLAEGGHFVCKIFESPETKTFRQELEPHFEKIRMIKPDASRDESFETYVVALGFRRTVAPDVSHGASEGASDTTDL